MKWKLENSLATSVRKDLHEPGAERQNEDGDDDDGEKDKS